MFLVNGESLYIRGGFYNRFARRRQARTQNGLTPAATGVVFALLLCCGGCKLVDQTTFGAKPVPPAPDQLSEALKPDSRVPLVIIRSANNTLAAQQDALRTAVDLAQARKPDAKYDVVTVVPARLTPDQQIAAAEQTQRDATDVMDQLSDLGVDPAQMSLEVRSDPAILQRELRIYVR
jgi:type IV pilus biogenesis protein CpaD/CtpE